MHSKQRQRFFACPMCDHKSNDVNNMKRHINTVHNSEARRVYRFVMWLLNYNHDIEALGHQNKWNFWDSWGGRGSEFFGQSPNNPMWIINNEWMFHEFVTNAGRNRCPSPFSHFPTKIEGGCPVGGLPICPDHWPKSEIYVGNPTKFSEGIKCVANRGG